MEHDAMGMSYTVANVNQVQKACPFGLRFL